MKAVLSQLTVAKILDPSTLQNPLPQEAGFLFFCKMRHFGRVNVLDFDLLFNSLDRLLNFPHKSKGAEVEVTFARRTKAGAGGADDVRFIEKLELRVNSLNFKNLMFKDSTPFWTV